MIDTYSNQHFKLSFSVRYNFCVSILKKLDLKRLLEIQTQFSVVVPIFLLLNSNFVSNNPTNTSYLTLLPCYQVRRLAVFRLGFPVPKFAQDSYFPNASPKLLGCFRGQK